MTQSKEHIQIELGLMLTTLLMQSCTRCRLCADRQNVVIGKGDLASKVMLIGEAPGANEDEIGIPFVGRAGKLLDSIMDSVDMIPDNIYITNIVKCRPPANRNPRLDEITACADWLLKQISAIRPYLIITSGAVATTVLLNYCVDLDAKSLSISNSRGVIRDLQFDSVGHTCKHISVFHPSYLLRNMSYAEGSPRQLTYSDFKLIAEIIQNNS